MERIEDRMSGIGDDWQDWVVALVTIIVLTGMFMACTSKQEATKAAREFAEAMGEVTNVACSGGSDSETKSCIVIVNDVWMLRLVCGTEACSAKQVLELTRGTVDLECITPEAPNE